MSFLLSLALQVGAAALSASLIAGTLGLAIQIVWRHDGSRMAHSFILCALLGMVMMTKLLLQHALPDPPSAAYVIWVPYDVPSTHAAVVVYAALIFTLENTGGSQAAAMLAFWFYALLVCGVRWALQVTSPLALLSGAAMGLLAAPIAVHLQRLYKSQSATGVEEKAE